MDCPSDEDLALFASGWDIPEVARHREGCERCAELLTSVCASDLAEATAPIVVRGTAEPAPGETIGRYVVLRRLGQGGMGVVLLAYDPDRDRMLALKVMREDGPSAGPASARARRFKREFRIARDLHHPNLVRLGELFEERGRWFFTMELIHGVELLSYVCGDAPAAAAALRTGAFDGATFTGETTVSSPLRLGAPAVEAWTCDLDRLRAVLSQLVRGLEALHRAGLIHRDVKPANVLVDDNGRAVLVDFGIAMQRADAAFEAGHVLGTVSYMAPEQLRGDVVGPAADWYALGAVLFVALTGRPPFHGSTAEVMATKLREDGPAPSSLTSGVPPELDLVCQRLLARSPALRPSGDAVLRALGATPEPVAAAPSTFSGRDALLAELSTHLAASRQRAVVVTLEGDAGIGKTTLAARAIATWCTVEPTLIALRGRCHEREAIPYNAIDGVIDDLGRELARLDDAQQSEIGGPAFPELVRLFPTLPASNPPAASSPALTPIAARRRAFGALREVFHRLAERGPLVVTVDDLQWADADSLALIEALLAPPSAPAFLLVTTARTGEARPWQPPPGFTAAHRHTLTGLGTAAVEAMAGAFGRQDVDLERLREETGGNPMLIEQWLSLPLGDDVPAPAAFDAVVAARAAVLSAAATALLEIVVVAGRAVPQDAAAVASGLDADAFDAAIAELSAARFARRDGIRIDAIDVFHDRLREHAYRALDPARCRALHGRLADALIAVGGAPDAIATQLTLAGLPVRAAAFARTAAVAAERALAFDHAAALYRTALAGADDADLAHLRARLAGALANAGRPLEAGDAYIAAAEAALLPAERLELRRRGAEQYLAGGYLDRGLAEASVLLAQTRGGRLPRGDLAAVLALLGHRARLATRRLRWRRRPEHELTQEVATRLDLHWSLSIGLSSVDSLRGAVFAVRLPLLCLPHGDELRIARALCAAAVSYAGMGLRRPAERLVRAAARAAESHGTPLARFYAGLGRLAIDFLVANDWRATSSGGEQLVQLWHQAGRGRGWELDAVEQFTCFADLWLGRFRSVHVRVDALAKHAADAGNRFQEVGLRTYFGVLDTLLGDPASAERQVEVAVARARDERPNVNHAYWAVRSRTYAAMYRGDVEDASRHLDPAWRQLQRSLLLRVPTIAVEALAALGGYELTRAVLTQSASARRDRLTAARRVARRLRRTRLPAGRMAYLNLAAGIAHASGDDDGALRFLRAAASTHEAAEMDGQVAATRLRLAAIIGGDEGAQLRSNGLAWFRHERIPDPERTAALLSPGWHPDAAKP